MTYDHASPVLIAHESWIALYEPSAASAPSSPEKSPLSVTFAVSTAFLPTDTSSILPSSGYAPVSLLAYTLSDHFASTAVSNTNVSEVMLHAVSADDSVAPTETIAPALPQNEPTIATAHVTATSLVLNLTIFPFPFCFCDIPPLYIS